MHGLHQCRNFALSEKPNADIRLKDVPGVIGGKCNAHGVDSWVSGMTLLQLYLSHGDGNHCAFFAGGHFHPRRNSKGRMVIPESWSLSGQEVTFQWGVGYRVGKQKAPFELG